MTECSFHKRYRDHADWRPTRTLMLKGRIVVLYLGPLSNPEWCRPAARHKGLFPEQSRLENLKSLRISKIALEAQLHPEGVDPRLCSIVHFNHRGPGALESFGLPFASRVDPHLGSVVRKSRRMIERVDGTERAINNACDS